MAFNIKTWVDRVVQYPSRKRLVQVSTNVYDFAREEGTVTQEGDLLNASNFNDLESRINNAFSETDTELENTKVALDKEIETNSQINASQDRRIHLLEEAALGRLYSPQTTTSYSNDVSIPSGALSLATLDMLGGMSRKGKNLLNPTLQTTTSKGITCTNNGDGTYTLNGTASGNVTFQIPLVGKLTNVKLIGCPIGGSGSTYYLAFFPNGEWTNIKVDYGSGVVFSEQNYVNNHVGIVIPKDSSLNNIVFKPMITEDTSLTYNDFEPYTPNLIDGKVDDVVVYGKNLLNPNSVVSTEYDYSNGTYTNNITDTKQRDYLMVRMYKGVSSTEYVGAGNYYATTNNLSFTKQVGYDFLCIKHNGATRDISIYFDCSNLVNGQSYTLKLNIVSLNATIVGGLVFKDVQLEKGSTSTSYAPYKETHKPIPSSVLSLPNYGIGINNDVYNKILFTEVETHFDELTQTKKNGKKWFKQEVKDIEIYNLISSYNSEYNYFSTYPSLDDIKKPNQNYDIQNKLIVGYENVPFDNLRYSRRDDDMLVSCSAGGYIQFRNKKYGTDVGAFKQSLLGVKLYYELAEPKYYCIDNLLDEDWEKLNVEANGHISFHYDNDYKVDIPNTISFLIKTPKEQ